VKVYLDTSVLVSLIVADANSGRAENLSEVVTDPVTSVWTTVEVTSALGRRLRMGALTPAERDAAEATFEEWLAAAGPALTVTTADYAAARQYVRRSRLRGPDALHLAVAARLDLPIATFDEELAEAARAFGLTALPA